MTRGGWERCYEQQRIRRGGGWGCCVRGAWGRGVVKKRKKERKQIHGIYVRPAGCMYPLVELRIAEKAKNTCHFTLKRDIFDGKCHGE